jgi:sugar/nucleoside kinase (ribokinase family)
MVDRKLFEKRKSQQGSQEPVREYKTEDCERISETLISLGAKIVVIKCGIRGLYLRTAASAQLGSIGHAVPTDIESWGERELWAATFQVSNFGSALGAGDATIAGFLCAFIHEFSPENSLQIANLVGWQNVQAIDALSGIGNWQGIMELLGDKNRPRNPVGFNDNLWIYSENHQVYYGPFDKR